MPLPAPEPEPVLSGVEGGPLRSIAGSAWALSPRHGPEHASLALPVGWTSMNLMRTNSWTSRRRRRRRRASQARTLARTGSCGNILPPRGGPGFPVARPSYLTHPWLWPLRPASPLLSSPDPPGQSPNSSLIWPLGRHPQFPFQELPTPLVLVSGPVLVPGPDLPSAVRPHAAPGSWWVGWLGGPRSMPDGPPAPQALHCPGRPLLFPPSPSPQGWRLPGLPITPSLSCRKRGLTRA